MIVLLHELSRVVLCHSCSSSHSHRSDTCTWRRWPLCDGSGTPMIQTASDREGTCLYFHLLQLELNLCCGFSRMRCCNLQSERFHHQRMGATNWRIALVLYSSPKLTETNYERPETLERSYNIKYTKYKNTKYLLCIIEILQIVGLTRDSLGDTRQPRGHETASGTRDSLGDTRQPRGHETALKF